MTIGEMLGINFSDASLDADLVDEDVVGEKVAEEEKADQE